jgi:hypothetical protein
MKHIEFLKNVKITGPYYTVNTLPADANPDVKMGITASELIQESDKPIYCKRIFGFYVLFILWSSSYPINVSKLAATWKCKCAKYQSRHNFRHVKLSS